MAQERRKKKRNIPDAVRELDKKQRARLGWLMFEAGYRKKSPEKQAELLPKLIEIVKKNSERRENEDKFAHNVKITSKHERRRRIKVRWRFYTFIIVGAFVILLSGFLLYSYVLVVDSVEVTGTARYPAEAIAAASGIAPGDKLFSPSIDAEAAEAAIIDLFPYIKSVRTRRVIPDKIILEVEEEEPVFVSDMLGRTYLLSEGLRVLEIAEETPEGSYIKLKLPELRSAVSGKVIEFGGDMQSVAKRAAEAVCSERLRDGTSVLDLTDRFNIAVSYGGRFRIVLGVVSDIEIKLDIAFRLMQDEAFSGGDRGVIDVSDVSRPRIVVNNSIDLS